MTLWQQVPVIVPTNIHRPGKPESEPPWPTPQEKP